MRLSRNSCDSVGLPSLSLLDFYGLYPLYQGHRTVEKWHGYRKDGVSVTMLFNYLSSSINTKIHDFGMGYDSALQHSTSTKAPKIELDQVSRCCPPLKPLVLA